MRRTLLLVPTLLAVGLLAACGSDPGDEGTPTTAPETETEGGAGAGASTTVSSAPGTDDPVAGDRALVEGELTLRVDGRRVLLSATTTDPWVVLRDLSLATTTPTGSSWDVLVTRPVGPRSGSADLPDRYEGVVAGPGEPVEVGVFELGPRPPDEVTLCVEVVPLPADQLEAAVGATVLLPPGDEGDGPRYLCGRADLT